MTSWANDSSSLIAAFQIRDKSLPIRKGRRYRASAPMRCSCRSWIPPSSRRPQALVLQFIDEECDALHTSHTFPPPPHRLTATPILATARPESKEDEQSSHRMAGSSNWRAWLSGFTDISSQATLRSLIGTRNAQPMADCGIFAEH